MKISKRIEKILRKEHSRLKKRIKNQNKQNLVFVNAKCKTLLECLQERWDYNINDLYDFDFNMPIEEILHDLRNGV